MKCVILSLLGLCCLGNVVLAEKKIYPSSASSALAEIELGTTSDFDLAVTVEKANKYLSSLTPAQSRLGNLSLDHPERKKWTNLPAYEENTFGLRLGVLDKKQITLLYDFIHSLLGETGSMLAQSVPLADDELLENNKKRDGFGAEHYYVMIFGKPSLSEPWAVQIDGHHLALNISIKGELMVMSPSFIGTQPKELVVNGEKVQPLEPMTKKAHELILSFSKKQRREAIISKKRQRLLVGAGKDGVIPPKKGISIDKLSVNQQEILSELIVSYLNVMPKVLAEKRLAEIKKEFSKTVFSWCGGIKQGSDISYRLQGPTVIIEYSCQSLGGEPTDHLHSVYRDPTNEYGSKF